MTVIEFAEERLNESCINDDDEAVLYWRAYLDGARAQKCDQPETCTAYVSVITNADRIREMSDEELAEFIDRCEMGDIDYAKTFCDLCNGQYECDQCRLDWLKQPAEGE